MINKPEAWFFTGKVTDKGHDCAVCDLCGRQSRFSFELKVRGAGDNGKRSAHAGSECAAKVFNPMAETEGLDNQVWMLKHKTRLYAEARGRRLMFLLLSMKEGNPDIDISGLMQACRAGNRLTPRQAMYLASLAKKTGTSVTSDIVPVALNTTRARDQIKDMKDWELTALFSVLSPRQEIICRKIRANMNTGGD